MANILIFDEVTSRAVKYIKSAHTPNYVGNPAALINPEMPNALLMYIKVVDGAAVEMTTEEKAIVDLENQPTYQELRRAEFEKVDGDLHDAISKTMQRLKDDGISIDPDMDTMLTARAAIKTSFPKA